MFTVTTIHDVPLALCAPEGPALGCDRDATDLIGELWGQGVDMVVVPAARFTAEFFTLRTRVAGEIVQKFVNYGVRLVVLGDVAEHVARSSALAAYVAESNRGNHVWFLPTLDDLRLRLAG